MTALTSPLHARAAKHQQQHMISIFVIGLSGTMVLHESMVPKFPRLCDKGIMSAGLDQCTPFRLQA
jgi:hypothetical protein